MAGREPLLDCPICEVVESDTIFPSDALERDICQNFNRLKGDLLLPRVYVIAPLVALP